MFIFGKAVWGPFVLKGLFRFFFVKILTIRAEYTPVYPLYKNAYKRLFCLNIKALTRRKK